MADIEYIYEPEMIDDLLKAYPSIHQRLGNLVEEGQECVSFPKCRKTSREIYRILTNQHYPRLADLLRILDYCLANGWEQLTLLRTRGEKEFESSVAELLVANSFLNRGLSVEGVEKGNGTIPDMLVRSETFSASVEVYCPLDWNGLTYFKEDLRLGILHLDIPWDFCFEVKFRLINDFDIDGNLIFFDPWHFSEIYENPIKRWENIGLILHEIETNLSGSIGPEIIICQRDKDQNILIEVRLFQFQRSKGNTPIRYGTIIGPTLTGYAPEGMFDRLVNRRIFKKIQRGQAQSLPGDHIRIMVTDVSRLGYENEFTNPHPFRFRKFVQSVKNHIDLETVNIDILVFCYSRWDAGFDLKIPMIFGKVSLSNEVLERLFGPIPFLHMRDN